MTPQLLPDDILLLILEEHLTPSTGYRTTQRLQTIKNFSLSSRTLALACRRLIFEHTKVVLGEALTADNAPKAESPAEGLKQLFEANSSYRSFVNSLRIESGLVCGLVQGASVSDVTANSADKDNHVPRPHEAPPSGIVSIRYTPTLSEEAAICWLLSQYYPNLKSFHFIIRQPSTEGQIALWNAAQLGGTIPSLAAFAGTKFPQAVVRFLSAGDQLQHLTLSSNLPPRILRHFNGSKLKSFTLTNTSEVEPNPQDGVAAPFYWGADHVPGALPISKGSRIEVEELCCDKMDRNTLRWVQGPDCSLDLGNLQTLLLSPAEDGRQFPLALCRASLTDLEVLYSSRTSAPVSLAALVALRQLTIRVDAKWTVDQVSLSLNTLQSRTIENLEIALRLTHVMDFKIIQLLTSLDRRLFTRTHDWANLKTLRIVGYMSEEEWVKVEERKGFGGFSDCLRSLFNPLLKGPGAAKPVLDVSIVRDSEYLSGR